MENVKIFFKTFFSVLFLLLLFGGLFFYYTVSDFEPVSKTVQKKESVERYIIFLQITGEDNSFFLLDINEEQNSSEIMLIPNCTDISFDGKNQSADYFYRYGGAEYLKNALSDIADIDGYIEFEWEFICSFADEISGISVDMPFSSEMLSAGKQSIIGDDFMMLLEYQSQLTEKGKSNFKTKLCEEIIKGVFANKYGISCDILYKAMTKYARTDIKSTDFEKIYALLREIATEGEIKSSALEGEYIGEGENVKFQISQNQRKKLKQSD